MTKFWIGVVSKEHVLRGVNGSFAQVCHGKKYALERMKAGDWFAYYSPVETFKGKKKLQAFTAIGIVRTAIVYQFEMSPDFKPHRVDIDYFPCKEVHIGELKSELDITKGNWGLKLRSGHFEVGLQDLKKIAKAMEVACNVEEVAVDEIMEDNTETFCKPSPKRIKR